ncbi:MAG: TolC family protein, partial [Bacteroidales bacterium]|nr:TolC family protein [Bacteroidales bacterium]
LEKRYRNLYREIDMATLQARTCYEQYTASLDQVSAMEESFKYAQKEFDLGLLTPFDYNYTRNQLLKARSESIQAKYKYLFQLKIIDYYQGETE